MDFIKITGLWKKKDKNDNTYFAGELNTMARVAVMLNSYKKSDKDPDFYLYISPNKKKEENESANNSRRDDGYYI